LCIGIILVVIAMIILAEHRTPCVTYESPSGRYVIEGRRDLFAVRFFAMPGDGGCGSQPGILSLLDRQSVLQPSHRVHTDMFDLGYTPEWGSGSVLVHYGDTDLRFVEWKLSNQDVWKSR
jgi:hypothetical protein